LRSAKARASGGLVVKNVTRGPTLLVFAGNIEWASNPKEIEEGIEAACPADALHVARRMLSEMGML
jgi:hypothetical protein